jgi:hypothetical protein
MFNIVNYIVVSLIRIYSLVIYRQVIKNRAGTCATNARPQSQQLFEDVVQGLARDLGSKRAMYLSLPSGKYIC